MRLVLDTSILGQLCHPKKFKETHSWFNKHCSAGRTTFYIPEVADYELRRKLLHMLRNNQCDRRSLDRLDLLGEELDYLELTTEIMREAAQLWADARWKGFQSSPKEALDGDVILAATTRSVEGTVVTTNKKHLSHFVPAKMIEECSI